MLLGMKGASPSSDWHVVRDPEAARALDRLDLHAVVGQLLGREGTASSLARDLELTLNAAYLKLRTLQRIGLVRVAREERRGGRAIKHYTAVAPRLFVPFEVMDAANLEELFLQELEEQARLFVRALLTAYRRAWGDPASLGHSLYRDPSGTFWSSFGPKPGTTWSNLDEHRPATVLNNGTVWLTFAEAKALQRLLYELHGNHAHTGPGRRPYRLMVGLSPQDERETVPAFPKDDTP